MTHPASQLSDEGHTPAAIAATLGLPVARVYAVLRSERPRRARAPRTRTSEVPRQVAVMRAAGIKPKRIASLLGVSGAYIYRIISDMGA